MRPPTRGDLKRRLEGLNVYLVGMPGAGKSAVGRPLADALGYRFIDVDSTLEQVAGRTIPEIFTREGEGGFRQLETAVLGQIAGWHSLVVATGGGVVTRPENWGQLHQGVVVWLEAPLPLLLERLQRDATARPLLQGADPEQRLRELLDQRRPLYAQADLHVCQHGEAPAQVAVNVMEALPSILKDRQPPPSQPVRLQDADGRASASLN